jgi:hypothetical protein
MEEDQMGKDYHTVTLKLAIKTNMCDLGASVADLNFCLQDYLDSTVDGRLPFNVELLNHAMYEAIRSATREAIELAQLKIHGRTPVKWQSPTSKAVTERPAWAVETERLAKQIQIHFTDLQGSVE